MRSKFFAWLIVAAAVSLLAASCGLKTGIEQSAERSYLKFTGNVKGASVSIDEGAPFDLVRDTEYIEQQGEKLQAKTRLFEIKPGKHSVIVSREGEVLVDRVFLIGNNQTKEIQVP